MRARVIPKVTSLSQARLYMKLATITKNPRYLDPVIEFFMNGDQECPIAEYLTIAKMYLQSGKPDKVDKAIQMLKEMEDFVCSDSKGEK